MTAIVGVVERGVVYLGADSAASTSSSLTTRRDAKVFRVGAFLLGACGSPRVMQLLRSRLDLPPVTATRDAYLNHAFTDAVRKTLKDGGALHTENGEEGMDAALLLGYEGHLYEMYGDFQIGEPEAPFAAVGSGSDVALGALHASAGLPVDRRLWLALEAAERFVPSVRRPFTYESLPATEEHPR